MNHSRPIAVYLLFLLLLVLPIPGLCASKTDARLTVQELAWIKTHPLIRLAVSGTPAPISLWGNETQPGPPLQPGAQLPDRQAPNSYYPGNSGSYEQQPRLQPGQNVPTISYYRGPADAAGVLGPDGGQAALLEVSESQQDMFGGVAADYLKEITAVTGIRFKVVLATRHNHRALHDAMARGEADVIPSVMLEPNSGTFPETYRTHAYIEVPVVIVTQQETAYIDNPKTLESMRVAGVLSVIPKLNRLGLAVDLNHVGPKDGLRGVATGKYDAFICELTGVSLALSEMPLANIKISGELPDPSQFAMEASPQIKDFIPIFNKALAVIPQERRNAIWEKWFRIEYQKKMISSPWIRTALFGAGLLSICALLVVFLVQRRFKRIKMTVEALDPHLLSVRMDQNVIITEVTEAFCRATGFDCKDLVGQPLMALGNPVEKSANANRQIWETLKKGDHWRGEVKIVKKDGSLMWVEAVVTPLRRASDDHGGYTAIYHDVSERKHFEKLAVRDELTGLYNRRHFNEISPLLLRRAEDEQRLFALILMDVDHFKKYNDYYGHPAGDKVLSAVGRELRDIFQRHDDMVFRMGGEEFGAVVVVSHAEEALIYAERIRSRVRELNISHKENPPGIVTISIGVCATKKGLAQDISRIYQAADKALYRAKSDGRNQVCLADNKLLN